GLCDRRACAARRLLRRRLRWGTARRPARGRRRETRFFAVQRSCDQARPGAGAVRPAVSGKPYSRFIHCTAPPAAPLLRLSTTLMTAPVLPLAAAERCAKLLEQMSFP